MIHPEVNVPRLGNHRNERATVLPGEFPHLLIYPRKSAFSDLRQDIWVFRTTLKIFCVNPKFDVVFGKKCFHFLAIETLIEVKREILKRLALDLFPRRSLL